jgi:hypothetical protein
MQGRGRRLDSFTSPSISNTELLTPSRRAPVSEHEYTFSSDNTHTELTGRRLLELPDTSPGGIPEGVPFYITLTEVPNTEVETNIVSVTSLGIVLSLVVGLLIFIITTIFN